MMHEECKIEKCVRMDINLAGHVWAAQPIAGLLHPSARRRFDRAPFWDNQSKVEELPS